MKQKTNILFITLLTVVNSPSLLACATCYGQSDSKLAEGMNWGILTLMVVVYGVLMGIAGFFAYIIYRSKRLPRSEDSQDSQLSSWGIFNLRRHSLKRDFWLLTLIGFGWWGFLLHCFSLSLIRFQRSIYLNGAFLWSADWTQTLGWTIQDRLA